MNKDLTVGAPSRVLRQFCLPMFGSILFQQPHPVPVPGGVLHGQHRGGRAVCGGLRHDGPLYGHHPFRYVPAHDAGGAVCPAAGRERHLAFLAGGLAGGQRAFGGILSDFHRPLDKRKNESVIFLTSMKALHFRMKESE